MNLYTYYKALALSDNQIENPVLIAEDKARGLASIKYNILAPKFSWELPHIKDARGLILDTTTGEVVARPYPKFFNYGENEYAYWPEDTSGMMVQEKLDGSLVIVATHNDELVIASSGSLTSEHSEIFTKYFNEHLSQVHLDRMKKLGETYTLCFEYTAPNNQIVIHYDKPNMVLHGVIRTQKADDECTYEMSYVDTCEVADMIGVDVVPSYDINSLDGINEFLKGKTNFEGFVVKFADGHRLKFKTEDYVKLHGIAQNLNVAVDSKKLREALVYAVVNDSADDLVPFLSDETKPILDSIVTSAREFIDKASHKKAIYLKENEQFATDNELNLHDIRCNIGDYGTAICEICADYFTNFKPLVTKSEQDMAHSGYATLMGLYGEFTNKQKALHKEFMAKNTEAGLINTQALTAKQKKEVSQDKPETIMDGYIQKVMYGASMEDMLSGYLTETYVTNVELSTTQVIRARRAQMESGLKMLSNIKVDSEPIQQIIAGQIESLRNSFLSDFDITKTDIISDEELDKLADQITTGQSLEL